MTVQFDLNAPAVAPRDAATVVLLRDGAAGLEVFFVKRRADIRFMGGAYVFPGGKLDDEDCDAGVPCDLDAAAAAARLGDDDGRRARGLHVAAARECLEEAGVLFADGAPSPDDVARLRHAVDVDKRPLGPLLAERALALRASALVPFARWITPRAETRRFDARFFLAAAPAGASATHDTRETVASAWLPPAEALDRARRREIVLVPPTWRTVEILSRARDVRSALALAPSAIPTLEPFVCASPSGTLLVALPGDPLHPEPAPVMTAGGLADLAGLATRFEYDDGAWTAHGPGSTDTP